MISQDKLSDIARCAWRIRRYAVRMGEVQGQGYCSRLLQPVLDICDRTRIPAYLENSKAENTSLYRRFGFEVTEELQIAEGVTLWLMWREPR